MLIFNMALCLFSQLWSKIHTSKIRNKTFQLLTLNIDNPEKQIQYQSVH